MSKRKKVFTKEWEKLIWKPFGRFLKLILFFLLLQVGGAASIVVMAVYILLGLLWFFSLGHIDLVKQWDGFLDKKVRPTLVGKAGRIVISLLGGWS